MKTDFSKLDLSRLPSPCFVIDELAIEQNLKILHRVQEESGARVLHALKAFSCWPLAGLTGQYLSGTCSSGLHEALLAKEYYDGEIHVFSAAFSERDLRELLEFANHIVFNSCSQLLRFEDICREAKQQRPDLEFGLRVNPQHSEGAVPIYDPCSAGSRLGIPAEVLFHQLENPLFQRAYQLVDGLHFHTLCEHNYPALERTLAVFEARFATLIPGLKWVNFGGGHLISASHYQVDELIERIRQFREQHQLEVYLEPGEAIAIESGVLVAEVLDVATTDRPQAILDTSATCHMPDTLEMPYRAEVTGAGIEGEKAYDYRLGGLTCLAGDVIGDYSFDQALKVGDRLVFEDMSHYTMVKTTTFNGTRLASIAIWNSQTDALNIVRDFGYEDFKNRLG